MPATDTRLPTKMPSLRTHDLGSIVSSCAAFAVSAVLAGGMVLLAMR